MRKTSRRVMHVSLAGVDNRHGVGRDIWLLENVLESERAQVTVNVPGRVSVVDKLWRELIRKGLKRPPYDIGLFVETPWPHFFDYSRINCLIPNQEWLRDEDIAALQRVDRILCKTHAALEVFERRGFPSTYIGFSGQDRLLAVQSMDYGAWLHVAGKSLWRGTESVIAVWARHPEWPTLTIVQNPKVAPVVRVRAQNINHHTAFIDDAELRQLQNRCGVHLCPSEMEGYGQTISESMSCGAVVMTTNASPMNEMVTTNRGVLVPFAASESHCWGMRYFVDEGILEAQINEVIAMPVELMRVLGGAARSWFEDNDCAFRERFPNVLRQLADESCN